MRRFNLVTAIGLLALGCGLPLSANAAEFLHPQQFTSMAPANYGPGTSVNATQSVQMNTNVSGGGLGSPNSINVQTNIEGSKTIDASSNINVSTVINGYAVDYGLNGATALDVIDSATAATANNNAELIDYANDLETDALQVVGEAGN